MQTVLITGASSGFGEAIARHFAARGNKLVLVARRLERLEKLKKEIAASVPVHIVQLDVRDREAVMRELTSLPAEFAEIDVLVNNAGLARGLESAQEADLDDWDTMIDTNCKGLTYCTRAILPGMVERNRGHVVNIASTAGSHAYPGANVYGSTKAFVNQFSANLRCDLFGTKVRVSNIAPGMAETEFSQVRFKQNKERAAQVYAGANAMDADDIARAVIYAVEQPEHLNINHIELMPVSQSPAGLRVHKES